MQKICQVFLFGFGAFLVSGCGPSKPEVLTEEKRTESMNKMDAEMKAMSLPKNAAKK